MKPEDILNAVGEVDEELIERAARKTPNPIWRWSGLAATLILVIGIAYVVARQGNLKPPAVLTEAPATDASETEAPETEAPESDSPIELNYHIAVLGDLYVHEFSTYNAVMEGAQSYGMECFYYQPEEDSHEARISMLATAIEEGCNLIVTDGYAYGPALVETAPEYPDVTFIGLNLNESDLMIDFTEEYPFEEYSLHNVLAISFQSEIAGYLAGYSAVKEGYSSLGYYTTLLAEETISYANGFAQGAQDAALEEGRAEEITLRVANEGSFFGATDEMRMEKMNAWRNKGTQLISTYGEAYLGDYAAEVGTDMVISAGRPSQDGIWGNHVRLEQDKQTVWEEILERLVFGDLALGRAEYVPYYEFVAPMGGQDWNEKYEAVYQELLDGVRECPTYDTIDPSKYAIEIIWE